MSQYTTQQKIELLDRKFSFLMDSPPRTFPFDLIAFVRFIREDEIIKDFVEKISLDFEKKRLDYCERYCKRFNKLEKLLKKLGLDNEDSKRWIGNQIGQAEVTQFTELKSIRDRLQNKLSRNTANKMMLKKELTFSDEDLIEIDKLIKEDDFDFSLWETTWLTSAGRALEDLDIVISCIQPKWVTLEEELKIDSDHFTSHLIEEDRLQENRKYVINLLIHQHDLSTTGLVKNKVKRVYEALRQEIGSTRLRLQVMDRYKIRSQWYNQEYLRSLIEENGKYIRNREDALSRDLALYLFEQGITVWYRLKGGQHEFDLVEVHPENKNPLAIEIKVYKESKDKKAVIDGFSQLHSYLSTLEANLAVFEGYYVVYRLGGALYEFPRKISTNKFTIYPILIDLGLAKESGRKQKKPILISEKEILEEIEAATSEK